MLPEELSFPNWLQIEVTTACNLKCTYCDHSWESIPKKHFPLELADRCFKDLPSLVAVLLQGFGEPTLYRDMVDLIRRIRKYHPGVSIQTVTNGMLNSNRAKDIMGNIDILYVSMDSLSDQYWKTVRVGGKVDTIKNNIEEYRSINPKLRIIVNCVVSKMNIDELSDLIYFCSEQKYFGLSMIPLFASGNGTATEQYAVDDIWQYMCQYARDLEKVCSEATVELYHPFRIPSQSDCLWPHEGLYVLADGTVTPCCVMSSPSDEVFGNLCDISLRDMILNHNNIARFKEAYKSHELCRKCMRQNFHGIWNRLRPLPLINP